MIENPITIQVDVTAPVDRVWSCWNDPEHIKQWDFALDTWECPAAANDLRVGGELKVTMAAKDKSHSFELICTYLKVEKNSVIEYAMQDGREVKIVFTSTPEGTKIVESFDPESLNSRERQAEGWQSILNNFKKHVEAHS